MNVSQPRPLFIRHMSAPVPFGCRWCGGLTTDHPNGLVPRRAGHPYEVPTRAQRDARHEARMRSGIGTAGRRAVVQRYLIGECGPEIQSIPAGTRIDASGFTPYVAGLSSPAHPQAILDTCDRSMPHDMRFSAPTSCPPFCPTRMDT